MPQAALGAHQHPVGLVTMLMDIRSFQCRKRHLARINQVESVANLFHNGVSMPQAALGAHQQHLKHRDCFTLKFQCRKRHLARINSNPRTLGCIARSSCFNAASGTWRASTTRPDSFDEEQPFQCRKRHLARINCPVHIGQFGIWMEFQCRKRHLARINPIAKWTA